MDSVESYIAATLVIMCLLTMMFIIRNWGHATVSRRRMYRMMLSCGIDEATARNPDGLLDVDMDDARRRCRNCPAPDTCDRWLNGETLPGNDFCPNAARFIAAAGDDQCRVRYELSRRPGRRLD